MAENKQGGECKNQNPLFTLAPYNGRMNLDLASQVISAKQMQTQASAQFAVMKKQQEMDKMLVEMVDAVSQGAPPPPGMGTRIDKSA